jgi:hypothetical protein
MASGDKRQHPRPRRRISLGRAYARGVKVIISLPYADDFSPCLTEIWVKHVDVAIVPAVGQSIMLGALGHAAVVTAVEQALDGPPLVRLNPVAGLSAHTATFRLDRAEQLTRDGWRRVG